MSPPDDRAHMRLVSLIVNLIRELPILELRLQNGKRFANLRHGSGDEYARELYSIVDDAEAIRILADAQERLAALKAATDARRTDRDRDDPDRQADPTVCN